MRARENWQAQYAHISQTIAGNVLEYVLPGAFYEPVTVESAPHWFVGCDFVFDWLDAQLQTRR
jgi:hypothetical protein